MYGKVMKIVKGDKQCLTWWEENFATLELAIAD